MNDAPQLIAYADRFGGTIAGLAQLLTETFAGAFGGVHVLPFYDPYDGADAGFDPRDHTEIDSRLGTWTDLQALAARYRTMADVIVNHMSSESPQFRDVVAQGDESPFAGMFLTMGSIFPDGASEDDLARIYRPRPGLPFTTMRLGHRDRLVWTTFTPQQIDLDIRNDLTWSYLTAIVDRLTSHGVTALRLDAIGYAGKVAGTSCFMTTESEDLLRRIADYAHGRGSEVLVEIHGHYRQQVATARTVDLVYDFALPPLVLHALTAHDLGPLARWLQVRPLNCITVLDTHDGIGIVDVAGDEEHGAGLLSDAQVDQLVEAIHGNSGGSSRLATGAAASNLDLYQVNCTFYDALGADDERYLVARLIQLFVPGVPQVYYVGLLAGRNDVDLLHRTGVGRDVNRHHYSATEIADQLQRPVVRAQLAALRLRSTHPAFGGTFAADVDGCRVRLRWVHGAEHAALDADVRTAEYEITYTVDGEVHSVNDAAGLAVDPALRRGNR